MGHRAAYVVAWSDHYELFYSHWGANVIEADLFWGPERALEFVRSQEISGEWLDERWCEGGACLTPEAQHLIFFGGEDIRHDPFLRVTVMALMQETWRGWTLEWAHRGILDLARVAGEDEAVVVARSGPNTSRPTSQAPRLVQPGKPWSETVLDVDGQLFSLENPIEVVLRGGPRFLDKLARRPPALVLDEYPPRGGAVIRIKERSLDFWYTSPLADTRIELAPIWPGWTLQHREELALYQSSRFLQAAGQPLPSWDETLLRIRDTVCRNIPSRGLDLEGIRAIHAGECVLEMNPLATRDVRPLIKDEVQQQQLFDQVARRVVPLF